jgi:hypothetical protein
MFVAFMFVPSVSLYAFYFFIKRKSRIFLFNNLRSDSLTCDRARGNDHLSTLVQRRIDSSRWNSYRNEAGKDYVSLAFESVDKLQRFGIQ